MTRFRLVISEALRSMGANLSTSIAATMTVLIGMFLLGLFIALGTWVVSWSDHVKRQLEVKVCFQDDAVQRAGPGRCGVPRRPGDARPGQGLPVRLAAEAPQADAEDLPGARERRRLEPAPGRVRGHPGTGRERQGGRRRHPRPALHGCRRGAGRQADVEAHPAGGNLDLAGVPRGGDHPARHVDAADRKHDPALDLLAATRDRGDEARRRDQLVRARPVRARGPAVRAGRIGGGDRPPAARPGSRWNAIVGLQPERLRRPGGRFLRSTR